MTIPDYTPKDEIRFWNKVNKDGSIPAHCPELGQCWEWTAHRKKFGYGCFWFDNRMREAHRISWIINRGDIPDGLWVLHKCDNPSCVNPNHLYIGNRRNNNDDMTIKERFIHKITGNQANEIRERFSKEKISMKKLGDEYGISRRQVSRIIHFQRWNR